jgi:ABC-type transport system substrate-binding protein
MRRAGYPYDPKTGEGGWPKTITYPIYKQGLYENTAQVLQQQLAKIGLRIEIKVVSYPTYLMMTKRRGTVALAPAGWQQDFPDPSDFFEPLFSTNAINDEDSNNGAFYSNPKLDELLVRGRRELDPAVRKKIYDEADGILCDEAPWAFEYQYRYFGVHQAYVKGLRWSAVWPNYVRDAWLDKPHKVASRRVRHDVLGSIVEVFR